MGFTIARVRGQSMEPGLPHGTLVLFRRRKGVKRGDVVLVDHPEHGRIVKKVSAVGRQGNIHLRGTSGRASGTSGMSKIHKDAVLGVMLSKLGHVRLD
jgi:signal peptidase I